MARVSIPGWMAAPTKVHGRKTTCMDREPILGATEGNMRENTIWTRSTVMVSISGQMVADMKVTGRTANSTVRENISSQIM
jgi:hypothetical protein